MAVKSYRNEARHTIPPSPYERLLKDHQVASVMERAASYVGYRATAIDGEPPPLPPQLIRDVPSFAAAVMKVCSSHRALEELMDMIPDAKPYDDS